MRSSKLYKPRKIKLKCSDCGFQYKETIGPLDKKIQRCSKCKSFNIDIDLGGDK